MEYFVTTLLESVPPLKWIAVWVTVGYGLAHVIVEHAPPEAIKPINAGLKVVGMAAAGAAIGSAIPGVGTVIGAGVGAVVGGIWAALTY